MEDERINGDPAAVPNEPAVHTDALGEMLSDPAFLQKLSSVLSSLQGAAKSTAGTAESTVPTQSESTAASASALPIDGLAAVLSNPAMMEKLPAVIAMLKPMMENSGGATPASASVTATVSSPEHSRETLLVALKPFLSKERGEAIDTILRISQLGSLLGQMK